VLDARTGRNAEDVSHTVLVWLTIGIAYRVPASPGWENKAKGPKSAGFTIKPGNVMHCC
jgi:hypothetical protein